MRKFSTKLILLYTGVVVVTQLLFLSPLFCLELPKTAEEYFEEGRKYYEQGNYNEAIESYTKAIKAKPTLAEAYYGRGAAYGMLGGMEQAIKDFDKIIEMDPNDAQAYYNKGISYEIFFKFEEAIEQYKLFIKHAGTQVPLDVIGEAKYRMGKLERILKREKEQLEKDAKQNKQK